MPLGATTTGRRRPRSAPALGLTAEQVERVYRDIEAKRRVSRYLHHAPLLVEDGRSG